MLFEGEFRKRSRRLLYKLHEANEKQHSDDIIRDKVLISKILLSDHDLIELLHNTELEQAIADEKASIEDYLNKNIFSYLYLPNIQSKVQNYICFDIDDIGVQDSNNSMKLKQYTFLCISHKNDVNTKYGYDRQDILAYIILDLFNWTNLFGTQIKKIYNKFEVLDSEFYAREIKFQSIQTNNLINGMPGDFVKDKLFEKDVSDWA